MNDMELKLVTITSDQLDSAARCILALKNEPFFFLWYQGKVLMNREMKDSRRITEAVRTMWKCVLCDDPAFDAAYNTIKKSAGDKAAYQAFRAWHDAVEAFRRERGKAEAHGWYTDIYQKLDEDTWNLMYANGYNADFLLGLLDAYYAARKGNETAFKVCNESHARTVFAYAFMCGMEAARKKANT